MRLISSRLKIKAKIFSPSNSGEFKKALLIKKKFRIQLSNKTHQMRKSKKWQSQLCKIKMRSIVPDQVRTSDKKDLSRTEAGVLS